MTGSVQGPGGTVVVVVAGGNVVVMSGGNVVVVVVSGSVVVVASGAVVVVVVVGGVVLATWVNVNALLLWMLRTSSVASPMIVKGCPTVKVFTSRCELALERPA